MPRVLVRPVTSSTYSFPLFLTYNVYFQPPQIASKSILYYSMRDSKEGNHTAFIWVGSDVERYDVGKTSKKISKVIKHCRS
jgi:hypothetical protein